MTKAELGTKRTCPNCGAKYYDLNRNPIICPRCGTPFELSAATSARARSAPPVKPKVEEAVETEAEEEAVETVSLEEADEEAAETGAVEVEVDDDEDVDAGDDEDDTFLADDEDDDDEDVEDIVGDVDEEE